MAQSHFRITLLSVLLSASCAAPREKSTSLFCPPSSSVEFSALLGRDIERAHLRLKDVLGALQERHIPFEQVGDSSLFGCAAPSATVFYQVYAETSARSQTIFKFATDDAGRIVAVNRLVLTTPRF